MLSLFIFKSHARGMRYGIGTYINQLSKSLLEYTDLSLFLINYNSTDYKEFEVIIKGNRMKEIHIPSPKTTYGIGSVKEKYAERIVDLLSTIISTSNRIVFQVNSLDALPIARVLKSKFPFPVVSVIHSAEWQFIFKGNKKKFLEAWYRKGDLNNEKLEPILKEKELFELSDMIFSVTFYMRDFIVKHYHIPEEKVRVVHNGIDNSGFHILDNAEKLKLKKRLGFRKYEKIVLFSGRLDPSKGLYFLFDAFVEVLKQNNNVRLVLIGEDSGPEKICQYLTHCENIWSKVTFTGFLEQETILKFYQIADIGIMPSIYDHCPYVALEMISYNIPLIITNIEGLNEILTANQSVYLTPFFDNEGNILLDKSEIAHAILSLVNDKEKIKRISSEYQQLIINHFPAQQMAIEVYSALKSFFN